MGRLTEAMAFISIESNIDSIKSLFSHIEINENIKVLRKEHQQSIKNHKKNDSEILLAQKQLNDRSNDIERFKRGEITREEFRSKWMN